MDFDFLMFSPTLKLPITSELFIVVPSGMIIFSIVPSFGAVTSITTLSVSISAKISSCLKLSPSFLSQFDKVPSKTDSGNTGDFMSSAMLYILVL